MTYKGGSNLSPYFLKLGVPPARILLSLYECEDAPIIKGTDGGGEETPDRAEGPGQAPAGQPSGWPVCIEMHHDYGTTPLPPEQGQRIRAPRGGMPGPNTGKIAQH